MRFQQRICIIIYVIILELKKVFCTILSMKMKTISVHIAIKLRMIEIWNSSSNTNVGKPNDKYNKMHAYNK